MTGLEEVRRRSKSVIVVEDEPMVRVLASEFLRDADFVVIEAQSAADAIEILKEHAVAVDVLFTDVQMPGKMDGVELVHYVRDHWPWIALLLASGGVTPNICDMPTGSRFIAKPYRHAHVIGNIQDLAAS